MADKEPTSLDKPNLDAPVVIGDKDFYPGAEFSKEFDPDNVSIDQIKKLQDKRTFILERKKDHDHQTQVYDVLKEINDKIEQLEIALERKRVRDVLQQQQEIHPPVKDECPLCLEMNVNLNNDDSFVKFSCCGKFSCMECRDDGQGKIAKCPFCRHQLQPLRDEEEFSNINKLAMRGDGWAMTCLGKTYEYGQIGKKVDMNKAIQWYNRAAETKEQAPAICALACLYRDGVPGVLEKNETKALDLFKTGAAKHNCYALCELGQIYFNGERNVPVDEEKAIKYLTLAIANDPELKGHASNHASHMLGKMFSVGYGSLDQCWNASIFYSTKALAAATARGHFQDVKKIENQLGKEILGRWCERYGPEEMMAARAGHNDIPQALYWSRKSLSGLNNKGDQMNLQFIHSLVDIVNTRCSGCGIDADALLEKGITLKNCARCKAIWYCSKDCQQGDWKAGHKKDCWATTTKSSSQERIFEHVARQLFSLID